MGCGVQGCDRPAVAWVTRRRGLGTVLLVRLDQHLHRTDDQGRCLEHAHDELDLAVGVVPAEWCCGAS